MTAFILTCSADPAYSRQTISTLKFGQCARNLKNKIKINKELSTELLKQIIAELEMQICMYKKKEEEYKKMNSFAGMTEQNSPTASMKKINEAEFLQNPESNPSTERQVEEPLVPQVSLSLPAQKEDHDKYLNMYQAALEERDFIRAEYEGYIEEQEEENQKRIEEKRMLVEKNIMLTKKIDMVESELAEKKNLIDDLQSQLKMLRAKNDDIEKKVSQVKSEKETMFQYSHKLEEENDSLRSKLIQLETLTTDITLEAKDNYQRVAAETEALQSKLRSQNLQIARLTQDTNRKDEWVDVLTEHVTIKNNDIRKLKNEYLTLKQDHEKRLQSLFKKLEEYLEGKIKLEKFIAQKVKETKLVYLEQSMNMHHNRMISGPDGRGNKSINWVERSVAERLPVGKSLLLKSCSSIDHRNGILEMYQSMDKTKAWSRFNIPETELNFAKLLQKENTLENYQSRPTKPFNPSPNVNTVPMANGNSSRRSLSGFQKATTKKHVRGGSSIRRFEPEEDDVPEVSTSRRHVEFNPYL
jgi:hypothetical protein